MQPEAFGGYCYGPVDLVGIQKGDNTMWLQLQDSAGRTAKAVYRGCVYWRLEQGWEGMHVPMVQRVTADELISRPDSASVVSLHKNSDDVAGLLREWEAEGLNFYLHFGSEKGSEYLVVAKSVEYKELG